MFPESTLAGTVPTKMAHYEINRCELLPSSLDNFVCSAFSASINDPENIKKIITKDIITPDGVAYDWIYNHLYWTDAAKDTIEVASFDGKLRKVLINNNFEEPRDVVVNPLDGWLYWSDWGSRAKIERAGMDGSHRRVIIDTDIVWPNGMTLGMYFI